MPAALQGQHAGKLLRYDPASRETTVLSSGWWFANGVSLSSDESFVAFVETNRQRVLRYWLKGPNAGGVDVLIDRLPGFPDGIQRGEGDDFWVALVVPITPLSYLLRTRLTRFLLAWLPPSLRPKVPAWGAVARVTPSGDVVDWLLDPTGARVSFVSSVHQHGNTLLLGNLVGDYVSCISLRQARSAT